MRGSKESGFKKFRQQREYGPPGNPQLDLHAMTIEQAKDAASLFIKEQKEAGVSMCRFVTGHGSGRIKNEMLSYLRKLPGVKAVYESPNVYDASLLLELDIFES